MRFLIGIIFHLLRQSLISNVNEFFCGLHFIVGLADQAEACLKVWEGMVYGDERVGTLAHGGYSRGESGTTRLIRTVCKSVQERGCEKSGRMVSFATVMREVHNITDIPLYPFLGNRFNILFVNGAGVYHLYPYLLEFFNNLENENKLLTAVRYDLNVFGYRVGCRVLGLIDKLVSGPLWRKIVDEKYALSMTVHYKHMVICFERWAEDSSGIVSGNESLFPELVTKDLKLNSLTVSDESDTMTRQCLEIIFGGFVVVSKRMLCDHLGRR